MLTCYNWDRLHRNGGLIPRSLVNSMWWDNVGPLNHMIPPSWTLFKSEDLWIEVYNCVYSVYVELLYD